MIVVTQDGVVVVLTRHAVKRFGQRALGRRVTNAEIVAAVRGGVLRARPPGWMGTVQPDGYQGQMWLVTSRWALVLRAPDRNGSDFDFVATTCLVHRRRAKADVRQIREQAAEDQWAA